MVDHKKCHYKMVICEVINKENVKQRSYNKDNKPEKKKYKIFNLWVIMSTNKLVLNVIKIIEKNKIMQ
jgi:hypothetical protein